MEEPVDILIRRANRKARQNRPVGTRQALARELEQGGVSLRVQVLFYRPCERQNRSLGRSWVVECRTPTAVKYVRLRLRDLMKELDGTILVVNDAPGAEAGAKADHQPPNKLR